MHVNYTITMTPNEKEKYRKIAVDTKELLVDAANKIEDREENDKMWEKIRKYNNLMEIFTEK